MGRAEVQLAAGDGGGRRSTSPLTAPDEEKVRGDINKTSSHRLNIYILRSKLELTTQPSHRSVRVAVSVAALPNVAGLELYGGLDVPHSFLAGLQMQAGEEWDAA